MESREAGFERGYDVGVLRKLDAVSRDPNAIDQIESKVRLGGSKSRMRSALHDVMAGDGASFGEYCGVETAAHFKAGEEAEFRAITTAAGVYDLSWRAKIAVTGEDRVRWMNGMVTNNIRDLKPGFGNYNFLLNAKGRILGDLYVYNRGDSLWIDTEQSQTAELLKTLEHFIIMDDVELREISEQISALAVQGPEAKRVLAGVGIEVPQLEPMQFAEMEWSGAGITVTPMESAEFATYEIWGSAATLSQLWNALIAAGAQPVGTRALEMFRVMSGVPKYGVDIRDSDLPQETKQEHALDFTKGCYIGQEIVERIRSRGAVHRMFTGFMVAEGAPERGTKLVAGGTEVGTITSVERVPTRDVGTRRLALGYIRREALERGDEITFAGGRVTPHPLPFAFE